jgi:hypothetical protein
MKGTILALTRGRSAWAVRSLRTASILAASWRPKPSPGYPVMPEYLPDIEGIYEGWLGREIRS